MAAQILNKHVLSDTSEQGPALVVHNGRLVLAWKGSGNDNLNVMISDDSGATFANKRTYGETSDQAPALASLQGRLFMAWKGSGNDNLNVAELTPSGGGFDIGYKHILTDTSGQGPALTSRVTLGFASLVLGWKGSGNDNLNTMFSIDYGRKWPPDQPGEQKGTFADTSDRGPALAWMNPSNPGAISLAWKGSGNDNLNVAQVSGDMRHLTNKVTLGETSDQGPALAGTPATRQLYLAWKGSGNDNLNLMYSSEPLPRVPPDPVGVLGNKTTFSDTSDRTPALALDSQGRIFIAWKGSGNENLNVAQIRL